MFLPCAFYTGTLRWRVKLSTISSISAIDRNFTFLRKFSVTGSPLTRRPLMIFYTGRFMVISHDGCRRMIFYMGLFFIVFSEGSTTMALSSLPTPIPVPTQPHPNYHTTPRHYPTPPHWRGWMAQFCWRSDLRLGTSGSDFCIREKIDAWEMSH